MSTRFPDRLYRQLLFVKGCLSCDCFSENPRDTCGLHLSERASFVYWMKQGVSVLISCCACSVCHVTAVPHRNMAFCNAGCSSGECCMMSCMTVTMFCCFS